VTTESYILQDSNPEPQQPKSLSVPHID